MGTLGANDAVCLGFPGPSLSSSHLSAVQPQLDISVQERQGAAGEGPAKDIKIITGLEHLSYEESERLWELSLFNLKRRLRGNLNAYKYHQGGCQDGCARLSSVVPSDKRGRKGHKLKHRKSALNMWNNFFTLGMAEHCAQGGRRVSLSGDIANPPGHVSVSPAPGDPWQGGLDCMISRDPF